MPRNSNSRQEDGTRVIRVQNTNQTPKEIDMSSVPKNAQCPCGSGKKFKNCHGKG